MSASSPTVDIVIPVYNEGPAILPVIASLRASVRTPHRILICYDSEEDTTLAALRAERFGDALQLVRNPARGAHAAIRAGFAASRAAAVVVFPADDTLNAGLLDEMVRRFEEGCEIVCASRFMPGGYMRGCPWLKALLVRSAAFTLRSWARLPTHDATNGFRLFSRRVLERLPLESSRGFAYSLELLVKCVRLGWRIGEVPARWVERSSGRSRFRILAWLPDYLRWYAYAFATSWFCRRAQPASGKAVALHEQP